MNFKNRNILKYNLIHWKLYVNSVCNCNLHKNKLYVKQCKQNFPSNTGFSLATELYFYIF